jgi:hypothetical protein
MRWAGHVACIGKRRAAYRVSVQKAEGKRPLGGPKRKFEDNIKMDLEEFRMGCMNWIDLAQHINIVTNLGVPKSAWEFIYKRTNC